MLRITLIRHATLLIELSGRTLLVDPMLAAVRSQPPVPDTRNQRRNPLVPLPEDVEAIVARADAVCVTHLHVDHLDDAAVAALAHRGLPVLCQPADESRLRALGFADVLPVEDIRRWEGLSITRTGGRHGTGKLAELLAPVSGFVLDSGGDRVYVAGDTVWCPQVNSAIREHDPTVVVVNAGEARLVEGGPITMSAGDVVEVARHARGQVIAVHMEALNHCELSRAGLRAAVGRAGVDVHVPADGETLVFANER